MYYRFFSGEQEKSDNSLITADQAFAKLIEQKRQEIMLNNLTNFGGSSTRVNTNWIIIIAMFLIFIFALIVLYIIVGWIEAPFKATETAISSISDWVSSLGTRNKKIDNMSIYQTSEIVSALKDQVNDLTRSQIQMVQNYKLLLDKSESLAAQLNHQSRLIHSLNLNLKDQIEEAVIIQRKQWESIGIYGPLKKVWISQGAYLTVYLLGASVAFAGGYSFYQGLYFIGTKLAANQAAQTVGDRLINALNWTTWGLDWGLAIGAGIGLVAGLGFGAYYLYSNLVFKYSQYYAFNERAEKLKEALAADKISVAEYKSELGELYRKNELGINLAEKNDAAEASSTYWSDFWDKVLELLI